MILVNKGCSYLKVVLEHFLEEPTFPDKRGFGYAIAHVVFVCNLNSDVLDDFRHLEVSSDGRSGNIHHAYEQW